MVGFNILMFIFSTYLCLSKVLECDSLSSRTRCPTMRLDNGRVRVQSSGRSARITCLTPFKLVRGNQIATCVQGKWDTESPICARIGCDIEEIIPHGRLEILYQGAKLEVKCDVGYTIDGPKFVYCNEELEWNEELRGCKEHDQIYLSCDFESSDDRFCGWKNDGLNKVDWFADNMSIRKYILLYTRHVAPGPSEYFRSNYISLNAGTYGYNTTGRLISPSLPPVSSKQRCLIFAYKVTSGIPNSLSELTVIFGGIPHWESQEGEGRAIIGLYQLNNTSEIVIEGKNCKAAIDNIFVTEGNSCNERPYEEETDSCHDNCGKITDGRCSCDWECYSNNNCCSDIQIKCPFIKPMAEIEKLYLTISTTTTSTVLETTVKNETLNVTTLNITPSTPIINSPKNGRNDTISIDQVSTMSIVKQLNNTSSTFAPESMKNSTTMTESTMLNATIAEVPKIRLVFNSTTPMSINPYSVTTSMIPKSSKNILVMDIQSNSSKTTNTPSMTTLPNTASSTADPSIINMTLSTEKLNITPNSIPKSSTGKTVSKTMALANITTSTFRPDKVNLTLPVIYIPSVITSKPVGENSSLATSKSIYFSSTTVSSKPSTIKLINLFSTPTKFFTENATSTPTSIHNSTKLSIKQNVSNNAPYMMTLPDITSSTIKPLIINITSSTKKLNLTPSLITKSLMENTFSTNTTLANVSSSVDQLSNKSQKINENKSTINYSTTRIPNSLEYLNVSTGHKNKLVVIDTSLPNLDLKPSEYNQSINNINISNVPNTPPIKIELQNKMPTIDHKNLKLKKSPHHQSVQNDNRLSDPGEKTENDKFGIVNIIIFIASICAVFITIKFIYSRKLLRFNKPINDAIYDPFVGTDDDSNCDIELTSKRKK